MVLTVSCAVAMATVTVLGVILLGVAFLAWWSAGLAAGSVMAWVSAGGSGRR